MKTVIALIGEPNSRKERVPIEMMKDYGVWKRKRAKNFHYYWNKKDDVIILGDYDNPKQAPRMTLGTAVHTDILDFVAKKNCQHFVYECDWIGTWSMFNAFINQGVNLKIIQVKTDEKTTQRREAKAKVKTPAVYIKAERERMIELRKSLKAYIKRVPYNRTKDMKKVLNRIWLNIVPF